MGKLYTGIIFFIISLGNCVGQTSKKSFFTIPKKFWRDTICQNNLRLNYTPMPLAASCQTPPVYDFIGNTLVQVYSGIATTKNDTNLSFSTLVNGFGNLSLITSTPILIKRTQSKNIVYYSDFFALATGTIPNQTGTVEEVLGTTGIGLNNSLLLRGDLNKLSFVIRHKVGMSYGNYPGLRKFPQDKIVFYHSFQFRIKSSSGALVFDFPLRITEINIKPLLSVGYYQKI
ncbi:MAG: hypothetical protein ACKVQB_06195 [Bacteroidia bacterium]